MRRIAIAAAALAACGKDAPRRETAPPDAGRAEAAAAPAATAPAAAAAGPACDLAPLPSRLPAAARVVAIGDLHGDLQALRAALRAGGLVDERDRWTGGTTVLVQTGDQLDRGDDEPEILALLARLEGEAAAAGGQVIVLNGNHELMQAIGAFGYVTPGGFDDYAGFAAGAPPEAASLPAPVRGRIAAFFPGGPVATELAARRVAVVVGDTAFAHAGPSAGDDLDAINQGARCWLAGQGPAPAAVEDDDGLVWQRAYGGDAPDCARLGRALDALGVARIVVGHTVQLGGINAACDGRLWRIDVGLAAPYKGPIEVLELTSSGAKVVRGTRLPPR